MSGTMLLVGHFSFLIYCPESGTGRALKKWRLILSSPIGSYVVEEAAFLLHIWK